MATGPDFRFPSDVQIQSQPARSGKGWLLGGCGCLFLILVICLGGSTYVYLTWIKPGIDFATESITMANESPEVKEILGEPVRVQAEGIETETGQGVVRLKIPVSGSKGSGVVVVEGKVSPQGVIERGSMQLEHDGQSIDLDPDAATPEPEIKIGDEDTDSDKS
jgi:hypothetical protein